MSVKTGVQILRWIDKREQHYIHYEKKVMLSLLLIMFTLAISTTIFFNEFLLGVLTGLGATFWFIFFSTEQQIREFDRLFHFMTTLRRD